MVKPDLKIDKNRIASSFSRAANSYDAVALLQRKVADDLIAGISLDNEPQTILDVGSGTGYCTNIIKILFPQAQIVSLDLAEAMLVFARNKKPEGERDGYICADAEYLPFQNQSFDLIISSLAIQWCNNYSTLFAELQRVLKIKGSVYMSTFGPKTLQELKAAWAKVDEYVHVNDFSATSFLERHIQESNFISSVVRENELVQYYSSLSELTNELKAIGAHNMNQGQAKGLSGREKVLKLKQCFEAGRLDGKGIPVTYALQYLCLKK